MMYRLTLIFLGLIYFQDILALSGLIVDQQQNPVANAIIVNGKNTVHTDSQGQFELTVDNENPVIIRQIGYKRTIITTTDLTNHDVVTLEKFTPKGLYLSVYGIGSNFLKTEVLGFIKTRNMNTLVIDVKGDAGIVPWPSNVKMANDIGARKITTVKDPQSLIKSLKAQGLYLIARIVTFKDINLAKAHPEWAVKTQDGKFFVDREHLMWIDPMISEAWSYSISLAKEAAELGFDEIQFDYVRFPDTKGVVFSKPNTQENRVSSIVGFLDAARQALAPYNVFTSADIFGYVCWNRDDTTIGQQLESLIDHVDYVSPMLYPSGFQYGIPGYRDPIDNPYEIIYLSLKNAQQRTKVSSIRFRPWIQAFKDYAFKKPFGSDKTLLQIKAADKFGSHGYLIWNSSNRYGKFL